MGCASIKGPTVSKKKPGSRKKGNKVEHAVFTMNLFKDLRRKT